MHLIYVLIPWKFRTEYFLSIEKYRGLLVYNLNDISILLHFITLIISSGNAQSIKCSGTVTVE